MIISLAAACAAISVPVVAVAASPHLSAPSHRTAVAAARCGIARPALKGGAFVWSANPGDGFAGGVGYELEITNTGRHACTLRGVPGVAAVLGSGHLVGSEVPGSHNGPLITLRPGATAHVALTVHEAGALCPSHEVTAQVFIYLPGHSRGQTAWMSVKACRGRPGGGVLGVGTIQAGTGIPVYDA
jgi:hypothetical protein